MKLEIRDLKKNYDGKVVLNLKSAEIQSGKKTGIIGPNGAGKSTLINLIAGLELPSAGQIFYDEKKQIPRQSMTLVFQKPYLLSSTVENNISYPLRLRGWSKDRMEERVTRLCEELNLTMLRRKKAWKLSGGETQKVALARALSFFPDLLLLDEPTANIDPATTAEIEQMLTKINETSGTTIVLITHNLAQARRVCDRCLFLKDGILVEEGDAAQMLRAPENPQTRRFIEGELLI